MDTNNCQLIDHSPNRVKFWPEVLSLCYLLHCLLSCPTSAAQNIEDSKEAGIDPQGNVYVSSDVGKRISVTETNRCEMVSIALDRQTVGCLVMRGSGPEEFSHPLKLEIYLKSGRRITIEPGTPIRDWHFWREGQQVFVSFGPSNGPGTDVLYDAASGQVVERLEEPSDESLLPQWAKSRLQIDSESLPMSPALAQERTKWTAKVLWEVSKIKPGMRRMDLLKVFTTEGGLSPRLRRTYVYRECPYIKVDVRFKAVGSAKTPFDEPPEDIIESISRPYLAWGIAD